MKKYASVDDCISKKAIMYRIICESKEDALAKAEKQFNLLTEYDKAQRDSFFVGLFEISEDGEFGDCIEIVKEYI